MSSASLEHVNSLSVLWSNMSSHRRASLQERSELGRRRSSVGISHRRHSTVSATRNRLNSVCALDVPDTTLCHPTPEELAQLVIGLPDDITFEQTTIQPPPPPVPQEEDLLVDVENPNEQYEEEKKFGRVDPLSTDEIKELLINSIHKPTCACGFKKAHNVVVVKKQYYPVYKYILETFTETRQLNWDFEPYKGDIVDDSSNGSAPEAWEIACPCQDLFHNGDTELRLPHTDCVSPCFTCGGKGSKRCPICSGSGWDRCSFCLGAGYKIALHGYRDRCHQCLGIGRKKCRRCTGDGIAICRACFGIGQIRYFVNLTVTWNNHVCEQTSKIDGVSEDKLRFAKGHIIFDQKAEEVSPIKTFPVKEVNEISTSTWEKHKCLCMTEKLLMQRQQLYEIPLTHVTYCQDQTKGNKNCYIYGTDNCTHFMKEHACCSLM